MDLLEVSRNGQEKDGKVTKEEFVAACLEQHEISKMLALNIVDIFVEDNWKVFDQLKGSLKS